MVGALKQAAGDRTGKLPGTYSAPILAAFARLRYRMPPFIFRCPNTGMNVQGWIADDPTEGKANSYESIACTICMQVHLVNPKTGKVLGRDKD